MDDQDKSKAELIEELETMRGAVTHLEARVRHLESLRPPSTVVLENRAPRENLHSRVEFIADFDVLEAMGLNVSESGISFELYEDLAFEMRFEFHGEIQHHRAHLVWVRRLQTGGYRFGLRFTEPSGNPDF
ncbi:MAG: PilZ domain-containing protein [Desulfococcaceae bacterium]